jgi:Protein of unknown function (DUF1706)
MKTDIQQTAFTLIRVSRTEFDTLIAAVPNDRRSMVGELKDWSPKDEVAHLLYWIELFAKNIAARRNGNPLIDTSKYLAMNDQAWHARKDWRWVEVEEELGRLFTDLETQINDFNTAALADPQQFTLEPTRTAPRPLLHGLIYELFDHPFRHFAGMYHTFGDQQRYNALATQMLDVLKLPGVSKWSVSTRKKIRTMTHQVQW